MKLENRKEEEDTKSNKDIFPTEYNIKEWFVLNANADLISFPKNNYEEYGYYSEDEVKRLLIKLISDIKKG